MEFIVEIALLIMVGPEILLIELVVQYALHHIAKVKKDRRKIGQQCIRFNKGGLHR